MSWLRTYIMRKFDLHDLQDLQVGARCGCCGAWMAEEIIPKYWPWSLCQRCIANGDINNLPPLRHACDLN